MTRELTVMIPYGVPQQWAEAFAAAGFAALRTVLRFSPGRAHGLALFGSAGETTGWPVDASPTAARDVARRLGLSVVEPPRREQLRVLDPSR